MESQGIPLEEELEKVEKQPIDRRQLEAFLEAINRGAQRRGELSLHPTTLEELEALPKAERDNYLQAFQMYKERGWT